MVFLPRIGLHALSDIEVIRRFRLNKVSIERLYMEIKDSLKQLTSRTRAIPEMVKLLSVLYFLAIGSCQAVINLAIGMIQATFSSHLKEVLNVLHQQLVHHVHLPKTPEEWHNVKLQFYKLDGIPKILGAIDCTHVLVQSPKGREEPYWDRKQWRHLGWCHPVGEILVNSCIPWLFTPVNNPNAEEQVCYNEVHISTRCMIECTFGVLKCCFRCLDSSGRVLQYAPQKVSFLFLICCMLHNITITMNNIDLENLDVPEYDDHFAPLQQNNARRVQDRANYIQEFFGQ
ncbi:putative nuclease HARBI1 [Bombina bombina]|uniref:putative nuclease HARBI1 n=1 Tax=Bombina bombina TaxID=8345 RepID=UPI00235A54B5|nr:putative nuclease HARBI1 [Bombina bombina]